MKQRKHSIYRLFLVTALTVLPTMSAWATTVTETRTPITKINLTIDSTIQAGQSDGDVDATSNDSSYYIDDVSIANADDNWIGGIVPRVDITLNTNANYYFPSASSDLFSFSGSSATFNSAVCLYDNETLIVSISLDALANGDLSVSGLEWDAVNGIAYWDYNPRAQSYEIRLYKDGATQTDIFTTSTESFHLAPYMDEEGTYFFIVRSIGAFEEYGTIATSNSLYVNAENAEKFDYATPEVISAGVIQLGHWEADEIGVRYINTDGSYACDEWLVIDDLYYYFNEDQYVCTGLINWNNAWYYCGEDGALCANTYTPDGRYVGSDGIVQ